MKSNALTRSLGSFVSIYLPRICITLAAAIPVVAHALPSASCPGGDWVWELNKHGDRDRYFNAIPDYTPYYTQCIKDKIAEANAGNPPYFYSDEAAKDYFLDCYVGVKEGASWDFGYCAARDEYNIYPD